MRVGPAGGTNGAYNAIMENTCVCEGYTRAMQYLLKLKGINSHNDDYYSLYDDPCWNACRYQKGDKSMPWLLKTKQEISEDHTLSFDERTIDNNHLAQSRTGIMASIQRNNLFRNTRISSINNTRARIEDHIKGQIKEGEQER